MDPIRVNYEEFPYKLNIGKNKIPKRLTPLTKFSQNKIRLAVPYLVVGYFWYHTTRISYKQFFTLSFLFFNRFPCNALPLEILQLKGPSKRFIAESFVFSNKAYFKKKLDP